VYNARCSDLQQAQQVAQSAALALLMSQGKQPSQLPHPLPRHKTFGSSNTRNSGSGVKPMELDTFQGRKE